MITKKITLKYGWFVEVVYFLVPLAINASIQYINMMRNRINRLLPVGNRKRGDVGMFL